MIIHGINPVREALDAGMKIEEIYLADRKDARVQEIIAKAAKKHIKIKQKERQFFKGVGGQVAQFVAARVEIRIVSLDEIVAGPGTGLILVIDQVEDPRNLGAILRCAASAGVDGVVIQSHRACGITPTVVAASAGAAAHLRIAEVPNIKNAIRVFREEGYRISGADAAGDRIYWDADFTGPAVLVLGSEGKGMRKTVRELCDEVVRIPMSESVASLNVSVSAGVLLFEVVRQRARKAEISEAKS